MSGRVQVLKSLNPKLSLGKYSISQILIFAFFAFVILFNKSLPFVWKIFILYLIFKLMEIYKYIKGRTCRAYRTHYTYWYGFKNIKYFPKANINEFGG